MDETDRRLRRGHACDNDILTELKDGFVDGIDLAHKPPSSFLSDVEVASLRTRISNGGAFWNADIRPVISLHPDQTSCGSYAPVLRLWRVSFADRRRTGTDVQQLLAGMYCSL
jgi:hypothetical protein